MPGVFPDYPAATPDGVNANAVSGKRVDHRWDASGCPRLRLEARVGNVPQTLKARRGSLARSSRFLQLHLTIFRAGALISASPGSGWFPLELGASQGGIDETSFEDNGGTY